MLTNFLQAGWISYFKCANMHSKLRDIDGRIHRRLRGCVRHDRKKPNRKMKNLIRLGIPSDMAWAWSRTRMGRWAIACSPVLSTTITNAGLERRGYVSMLSYTLLLTRG